MRPDEVRWHSRRDLADRIHGRPRMRSLGRARTGRGVVGRSDEEGARTRHHARGDARPRHRTDRGRTHPRGGLVHGRATGGPRCADVLALGTQPRLDARGEQGSVDRAKGPPRGTAARSCAPHGRTADRLADRGAFLLGHGSTTAAAHRTVAGEGAALLRLSSDRLGHERLLVAAVEAVYRNRDRRLPVFAARDARRDRSGRRVGATPGTRDGGRATVLRAGAKESLSHAAIPLSRPRLPTSPWRQRTRLSSGEVTTVSSRPRTSRRPASTCWSSNAGPWSAALASR